MSEFELIQHYFATQTKQRSDVIVGIGDDAAIVKPPQDHDLVITTDTVIAGVHFPESTLPYDVGYKSLAVNLSDLAAMGAKPAWVMLALTLPQENDAWLQKFCHGFFSLANHYNLQLIGGDVTRGHLSITIQAMGFTPYGKALLRSGAKAGDLIYVTGTLGDAACALQNQALNPGDHDYLQKRLNQPQPRLETGELLRHFASSAIDISDGLAADLKHVLEQSKVGANVNVNHIPLSTSLTQTIAMEEAINLALTGGDDYELCFTIPEKKRDEFIKEASSLNCKTTCIGVITSGQELQLYYQDGKAYDGPTMGYQHF